MCGIVAGVAEHSISPFLLEGLQRLEYRGYDSAGIATVSEKGLELMKKSGKVSQLKSCLDEAPLSGKVGIAHTRWATHGKPCEINAHPHIIGGRVALVHNGIIENYKAIQASLCIASDDLKSETDSEVIAAAINHYLNQGHAFLAAVQETLKTLDGAFALCVIDVQAPDKIIVARVGSPLVIGLGKKGNYIGSDPIALQNVASRFIYLEEGDVAEVSLESVTIYDEKGHTVERDVQEKTLRYDIADKGVYRHYMQKEIFEQPHALANAIAGRVHHGHVLEHTFGLEDSEVFDKTRAVSIVACGTSYYAGLVAKYWIESLAGLPCSVEIASEFRYRERVILPNTLFVSVSQSGETADTLAALRDLKNEKLSGRLGICNVAESALVRESDLVCLTNAGPEIGVATTKGFTTQLVALLMLATILGRKNTLPHTAQEEVVAQLESLPKLVESILSLEGAIQSIARSFRDKSHALFLGRGLHYPVALEGALKLKEISYIHAEAYPAGELKHGPLALVDKDMPVVVIAPKDALLDKLKANIQEVHARGGELIVLTEEGTGIDASPGIQVLELPSVAPYLRPIAYTIPLQLLAYHVAVLRGTDVDQPRNLAKSVTVE